MAASYTLQPLGLLGLSAASYGVILASSCRIFPTDQDPRLFLNTITDVHSVLSSAAVLYALSQPWSVTPGTPTSAHASLLDDSLNGMIHGKSTTGNAITSWEAGYLVYETLAVALLRYKRRPDEPLLKSLLRFSSKEPLTFSHHLSLIVCLGCLQFYIAQGRERGVWIINAFNLMNASTPILHWRWLHRHRTGKSNLKLDLLLAATFAACRMGLIIWVLSKYGSFHGIGAWEAFVKQRWICKIGTAALFIMNSAWWLTLVKGIAQRLLLKQKRA
ncbi:hypothetical protein D0864_12643 [Hortaea werneckii]|uniref:TLC domain-containing protein n=1 Tax=Hortaea werneckii TaxID=91943 RepID=A0A3M7DH99_HORWE|nr:hypothetical protein KC352_g12767 [Hortaea werneckii]KAI7567382.1 hypothetical protein KC317_g5022 [Hortaea werneckii]KAI7616282.1 hypothetical protein KC346_g6077 [Hortaea werneckii]KAI7662223.1 hypothetical protein KC319_g8172 [Hortaea werneckii]KAI7694369.1 hypothetical protein KC322_g10428 [Hortaea werneckii]